MNNSTVRKAIQKDVPSIVQLLADDKLGQLRENYTNPLPEGYYEAFEKINADPNQQLIVVENEKNELIGTLQLSFIQYLTYRGESERKLKRFGFVRICGERVSAKK